MFYFVAVTSDLWSLTALLRHLHSMRLASLFSFYSLIVLVESISLCIARLNIAGLSESSAHLSNSVVFCVSLCKSSAACSDFVGTERRKTD